MLGYVILAISVLCYVLRKKKVSQKLINNLRLFNLGLCAVMIFLNPWLLIPLGAMLLIMFFYLKKRGLPKKIGLWA